MLPGEDDAKVPKDYLTANLVGQLHYMLGFTFEQRDWRRAREQFDLAAAASPDNDVLFYNLGLIYERNGLFDEALAAFARSQAINPRHVASSGRVRAADRLAELRTERDRIAALERSLADDATMQGRTPGTPDYEAGMAALLKARGEPLAARGHRLRTLGTAR